MQPSLLVPASVIAALLLLAAPVRAAAAGEVRPESVSVEFDLVANHGLKAHVESSDDGLELEFGRRGRFASYEVDGEITATGLKAQFGKLGLFDVSFEPTRTLGSHGPPRRCEGEPATRREGFFVGTLEFAGERDFVRVEASRAKGQMSVIPERRCPALDSRAILASKREPASLVAADHRHRRVFAAYAVRSSRGRGQTLFLAAMLENKEGMEITRLTTARAGPSTFVFDHEAGTARVDPPRPFSGGATFERRPHGPDRWQSTIRAPLLGADLVGFRGHGFRARLVRDLPGD